MLAMQEKSPYLTPVNTVLVLANVAVYFILEAMGDTTDALFMYAHGAMYPAACWPAVSITACSHLRLSISGFPI